MLMGKLSVLWVRGVNASMITGGNDFKRVVAKFVMQYFLLPATESLKRPPHDNLPT